jgi:hypothetical protein
MADQLLPIAVHEVTGCADCPFFGWRPWLREYPEGKRVCDHTDGGMVLDLPYVPPETCPLRKAHLLVELKR